MPERDIESLGVMGWGLAAAENSSAVVAVAVAAVAVAPGGGALILATLRIGCAHYWLRSGLAALWIGCAQDWLRSGLAALRIGCAHYRHGIMLVVSYDYKTSVESCS